MTRTYLLIALGGALGSVARAWGSALALRLAGAGFPLGTIAINVLGSFVIGLFAARAGTSDDLRAFVMVGICGGFTTFSSFSLQTLELLQAGRVLAAMGNVALSVALCLLAVAAGHAAGGGGG
ncbi:fluoride efflux transporter CrcB [Muricoccus pecuniae]|uniref:Fluoride-specific ion channel FluC n=1 Tax=Muricoccus pecuniae TaxID=693023 RepID=A0A840Y496_9PROT|nr:fluoride efflux transporter CrcB [Roseomonas pecuniae]MBB5694986.1 CrcB protein [Roseomonas pecuniae]